MENISFEVIEIYPQGEINHKKWKEKGTVHLQILIHNFPLEIKNITYLVTKKNEIFVKLPYKKYEKDGKVISVPIICLKDEQFMQDVYKCIQQEIKDAL